MWVPGAESLSASNRISPLPDWENCNPTSAALLTFTSGSTGLPKAAVRTHGFLLAQHRVLEKRIELVPGEVDLTTLPIFLLANLAFGVTSVVPDADLRSPGAILAEPVLQQIKRHNVTRAAASPALFERLLGDDVADRAVFRGLRKIYTGGAPVFPRLLSKLSEGAPDAQIEAVYGSTEAEPIAHLNARCIQPEDRLAMRRGNGLLAGKPIPEIRLRIIQDQWGTALGSLDAGKFDAMQAPSEQIGEIVVAGDHVLKGYLHGRGNEETKFSVTGEVWHRTGDAGKFDATGRLWLMGRCAARIDDARGQLYPFAVECVANDQAGVRRAAFLQHGGARLLAIEPNDMCDINVERDLRSDLAWASIDRIIRIKKLPVDKRHNAKIDYPELRRLLKCEV
jgi:acyl-CoA synthetase (AMP-forming)/AMP-acid ligase II